MIGGILGFGRAMAATRMLDTCRILRVTRSEKTDEATGKRAATSVTVYEGPCRFKQSGMAPKDVQAASQLLTETNPEVHLPMAAAAVQAGDIVECLTSPAAPAQEGRKYTVSAPFDGSQTTALRFRIEAFHGR